MQDGEGLLAHLLAQPRIEAGERLVHEQHRGPRRDGARERDALLLAAGEDMGIGVGIMAKPDAGERGHGLGIGFAAGQASGAQRRRSGEW